MYPPAAAQPLPRWMQSVIDNINIRTSLPNSVAARWYGCWAPSWQPGDSPEPLHTCVGVDRGWAPCYCDSPVPFYTVGCGNVSWHGGWALCYCDSPVPLHTAGCELTGVEPSATVIAPSPCIQQGVNWLGLSPCYCDSPAPCIQQGVSSQRVEPSATVTALQSWPLYSSPYFIICTVIITATLFAWSTSYSCIDLCTTKTLYLVILLEYLRYLWAPATVTAPPACIEHTLYKL